MFTCSRPIIPIFFSLLSISLVNSWWWVQSTKETIKMYKIKKSTYTHTIWCWWGFNRQQYSDYQSYLNTERAIKCIRGEKTPLIAIFKFNAVQKWIWCKKEAINEVNNSDTDNQLNSNKKYINDRNQNSHHANALNGWHFLTKSACKCKKKTVRSQIVREVSL